MAKERHSRLAKITDEVSDLHPLLKDLLPKLPDSLNVEYTHGPNEMGADFILSRNLKMFGTTSYVGVIAKVGSITQNHSDIERQIEECEVPRFFSGGKEKIRITEIWVVSTGTITKNAQEKIHEKYKLRNIHFIDEGKLEKFIDEYLPVYWTNIPVPIGAYLSEQHKKIVEIDRAMSLVNLTDQAFYIEPDIQKFKRSDYKLRSRDPKPPEKIDIRLEIESAKLIFIEAGFGAGKSKLLRQLFEYYTKPEKFLETQFLPIYVPYKDLVEKFHGDTKRLIQERINQGMRDTFSSPKYLLLIDGVDEKNLSYEEQIQTLKEVLENIENNKEVKAIITSRPIRAFEHPGLFAQESYRYSICPLSIKKTTEFLQKLCSKLNLTHRLIEDLKKSPLFKELPKSPIAAILLAKLLNENSEDLPSSMTDLYAKYIELILGRWDINKGLHTQKEYEVLDIIMGQIAIHMIEHELQFVSVGDAKNIFDSYLSSRHFSVNAKELFAKMLNRCEIMALDPSGNMLFFKHRSFAEFLCAKSWQKSKSLAIDSRAFQIYWMNVYFFYLGLSKDCPEILNQIGIISPSSEGERLLKCVNMSNYLLAAYASPYNVISDLIRNIMVEASSLYLDIIKGKKETPFSQFSQMTVLWIFQFLMRTNYSYEFFKSAIEDSALKIEASNLEEELKLYSLFFLNVTYLELGQNESFDFLLKSYVGKLPLDLMTAVDFESKEFSDRNALMRKQDKYVKRLLKGNSGVRSALDVMLKKPLANISKEGKSLNSSKKG